MGSSKQRTAAYMAGFRRGVIGLPCKVPATVDGAWDFADRKSFEEGHASGERARKSAEQRARKQAA